jgi:hypothetical protein
MFGMEAGGIRNQGEAIDLFLFADEIAVGIQDIPATCDRLNSTSQ